MPRTQKHLLDNPTRIEILKYLAIHGESYNAEISQNLIKPNGEVGYDESTIIRDIVKLVQNGYVHMVLHPELDKKKYYVITAKGKIEMDKRC
jgi:DNA-binding PadR family transcriptional regulator